MTRTSDFAEKALVVLKSVPARLSAVVAVLTVLSVAVVPVLPVAYQAKAAAALASAIGACVALTKAVARLTEVAEDERGILPGVSDIEPDDTPYLLG